jgi:hypothetical protein
VVKDPVDYALDSVRFLQYFLYNQYMLSLNNPSAALVLPTGVVLGLSAQAKKRKVFKKYLELLHMHFFERVLAYSERVSSIVSGAALLSKFLYVSGQLVPWYVNYNRREYS